MGMCSPWSLFGALKAMFSWRFIFNVLKWPLSLLPQVIIGSIIGLFMSQRLTRRHLYLTWLYLICSTLDYSFRWDVVVDSVLSAFTSQYQKQKKQHCGTYRTGFDYVLMRIGFASARLFILVRWMWAHYYFTLHLEPGFHCCWLVLYILEFAWQIRREVNSLRKILRQKHKSDVLLIETSTATVLVFVVHKIPLRSCSAVQAQPPFPFQGTVQAFIQELENNSIFAHLPTIWKPIAVCVYNELKTYTTRQQAKEMYTNELQPQMLHRLQLIDPNITWEQIKPKREMLYFGSYEHVCSVWPYLINPLLAFMHPQAPAG